MTHPKKPIKPASSKDRATVGSAAEARSRRAAKVATKTSDPARVALPPPRHAEAAPGVKNQAEGAGANRTRPADLDPKRGGADPKAEADGSKSPAESHFLPLDAVLEVGECLNTITFHLIQDQLLWDDAHRDEARRVLGRLGRLVRRLVRARDRSWVRDEVISPIERMIEQLGRGQRYENLTVTNENLRDESPDFDLSRYRRGFVEPVVDVTRDSLGGIEFLLRADERALLVLELGQVLDQGVHPVDPDGFYFPTERPAAQVVGRRLKAGAARPVRPEDEEDLLANRSLRGGEAPPAESWADDVRQLLDEVSMLEHVHVGLLTPRTGEDLKPEKVVAYLRKSILSKLVAGSATHPDEGDPVVGRTGGSRRGQNEARDAWLYKQHIDRVRSWVSILGEMNSKPGFYRVGSVQSVIGAVTRHAKRHNLPGPFPRDLVKRNDSPKRSTQLG